MIDIDQIKNRPFGPRKEFCSISEYNTIAKKVFYSIGRKYGWSRSKKLIHDDSDIIANLVHTLVLADSRYDSSKGTKLTTWRYNCCKRYLNRRYNENKKHRFQHLTLKDSHLLEDPFLYKQKSCENKEIESLENKELFQKYFSSLSEKQNVILQEYYFQGKTMKVIAKSMNLTKQRIDQILKEAIIQVRALAKKDNLI